MGSNPNKCNSTSAPLAIAVCVASTNSTIPFVRSIRLTTATLTGGDSSWAERVVGFDPHAADDREMAILRLNAKFGCILTVSNRLYTLQLLIADPRII